MQSLSSNICDLLSRIFEVFKKMEMEINVINNIIFTKLFKNKSKRAESMQPLDQDQQNSKKTNCRLPIIIFLLTPKGFISPESFLNFFPKPVCIFQDACGKVSNL